MAGKVVKIWIFAGLLTQSVTALTIFKGATCMKVGQFL